MIELSGYLEKRIAGTAADADKAVSEYNEIGKVVTVGDGIARVYGLNNVQAGEVKKGRGYDRIYVLGSTLVTRKITQPTTWKYFVSEPVFS